MQGGHQLAQIGLVLTQQIAELAHQLPTARGWHFAPGLECVLGAGHVLCGFGGTFPVHGANLAAINRRVYRLITLLIQRGIHTKTIQ